MYKVIHKFDSSDVGDVVELNGRRAKSELRNGNVVPFKKPKKKTKEQKFK